MEEKNIVTPLRLKVLPNLNKNVLVFGLNFNELIIITLMIIFTVFGVIILKGMAKIFVILLVVIAYFVIKRLRKENKKGYPNYLDSLHLSIIQKKKFIDENNCLKYLKR